MSAAERIAGQMTLGAEWIQRGTDKFVGKYNENHDELGRFSSGDGGQSMPYELNPRKEFGYDYFPDIMD
jgi:hypothetical protein